MFYHTHKMCGRLFALLCLTIYGNCVAVPNIATSRLLHTQGDLSNRDPRTIQTPYNSNEIDSFDIPTVCASEVCVNESIFMLNRMDQSAEPCENFYDFVCGKYLRETVLAEDKSVDLIFYKLGDKLREQLRDALLKDSEPNESLAFRLAKQFTRICLDEKAVNAAGIEPMLEFLEKYGGWPVLKGDNEWNEDAWDWLSVKRQISHDGFVDDIILEFALRPDNDDSSKYAIFVSETE